MSSRTTGSSPGWQKSSQKDCEARELSVRAVEPADVVALGSAAFGSDVDHAAALVAAGVRRAPRGCGGPSGSRRRRPRGGDLPCPFRSHGRLGLVVQQRQRAGEVAFADARHAAIVAVQTAAFQVFVLASLACRGEGVQLGLAGGALHREPYLVAVERAFGHGRAEESGVAGGEDQLGDVRVGLRILEEADDLGGQQWVEAGVEFVGEERPTTGNTDTGLPSKRASVGRAACSVNSVATRDSSCSSISERWLATRKLSSMTDLLVRQRGSRRLELFSTDFPQKTGYGEPEPCASSQYREWLGCLG